MRGFSKIGRKETGAEARAEENARRIQGDGFTVPLRVPSSEMLRAELGGGRCPAFGVGVASGWRGLARGAEDACAQ